MWYAAGNIFFVDHFDNWLNIVDKKLERKKVTLSYTEEAQSFTEKI